MSSCIYDNFIIGKVCYQPSHIILEGHLIPKDTVSEETKKLLQTLSLENKLGNGHEQTW